MKKLLFSTIFTFCTVIILLAQGTISGTLLDKKYGDPLIGANVVIEGTSIGTSTDFDGKYQFPAEPGTYNLVASYIGYNDQTITDVVVKEGEITYLDVSLSDEALDLVLGGEEGVVVKAKAINRSENALMILQKKSDNIQDGISSQEMSRYSVSDAGGAMKKVTGATVSGGKYIYIRGLGDRYSLTQLNGLVIPSADPYRNGAQLDLIPTNLLENIITTKTFTPDQPGNFTGGNVNLETKSFPEQAFFTVSTSTSYNAQNNLNSNFLTHDNNTNYFGYTDGGRNLPNLDDPKVTAALGFGNNMARIANSQRFYDVYGARTGVFENREDYAATVDNIANSFSTEYTPNKVSMPLNHGLGLSYGNQFQMGDNALGVIASVSAKKEFTHREGFVGNWFVRTINEERDQIETQGSYDEVLSNETSTLNGMLGATYKIGAANTLTAMALYNHNGEIFSRTIFGERPDNLVDDWRLVGRSVGVRERELLNFQMSGTHLLAGLNNAKIEWKGSRATSSQLEPSTRFFENDFNIQSEKFSIPASDVQVPFIFSRELEDTKYDAKLDITIPLANSANKVKFGGLYTTKDRVFDEERYQLEDANSWGAFDGDPDAYLLNNYGLIEGTATQVGIFTPRRTTAINAYTGTDEVTAFYGMLTYNFNERLKMIGGARYEKTNLEVISAAETVPVGRIDATDILPSANLVYSLTPDMNLRASYSQTVARPNIREISAFEAFDPLTKQIIKGNPNIERTNITNYDLRWEWFTKPGELFAVSGYYKDFTNPIVLLYERASTPTLKYDNVDEAIVYGVEFEFRKSLGALSPALKDFKFNTNVSFIHSESDVKVSDPEFEQYLTSDTRPFEGQAPFIVNVALVYSNLDNGIDASLSLNAIGDRLSLVGEDVTPDIYTRGVNLLDFTFSKKFGDLGLRFSAKNLLNATYTNSSTWGPGQLNDPTQTDNLYGQYQRGVTFGLGVSYTIK